MAKSTEGLLDLAMKTNVEVGLKWRTFLAEAALGEHCIKGFWRFDRCHFEMHLLWPYSESNSSTVLFFVTALADEAFCRCNKTRTF